mgnify:CR=1 FL=1
MSSLYIDFSRKLASKSKKVMQRNAMQSNAKLSFCLYVSHVLRAYGISPPGPSYLSPTTRSQASHVLKGKLNRHF